MTGRRRLTLAVQGPPVPPRLSLCETVHAGPLASNHVRIVGEEGLKLGGGAPGSALCGRDLAGGWDLRWADTAEIRRLAEAINDSGRPWVCRPCADVALALLGADPIGPQSAAGSPPPADPAASTLTATAVLLNRAAALLEKRAAEATQGEDQDLYDNPGWSADEDPGCLSPEDGDRVTPLVRACDGEIVAACESRADADLIATMNPHVVAALAAAFRDMAEALEVQERVRLANPGEPFRPRVMPGLPGLTAAADLLLREEDDDDA